MGIEKMLGLLQKTNFATALLYEASLTDCPLGSLSGTLGGFCVAGRGLLFYILSFPRGLAICQRLQAAAELSLCTSEENREIPQIGLTFVGI